MKKCIALSGIGGTGKTTTLNSLFEKLKNHPLFRLNKDKQVYENAKNSESVSDMDVTFYYGEKLVGLTTYGDNRKSMETSFERFENEECEIVICASRVRETKTGSKKYLGEKFEEITWVEQPDLNCLWEHGKEKFKKATDFIDEMMVEYLQRKLDEAIAE